MSHTPRLPTLPACEPQAARRLLGVSPTAGAREVDRRFRRLARRLHPDVGGDPAAFRELLDARAALDRSGARRHAPRTPLVVVRRSPWWRRLPRMLVRAVRARVAPPPPRVR